MTAVNTTSTSLKDAINICLSCIGETPVDAPNNTSTNVVLSKQIIEEVSRDVQSKGWWFNTTGTAISILSTTDGTDSITGDASFNGNIPEEARRYISIRAARVLQSRFVGSEELLKFSFQEEQVSLAILTQAHVRNNGDSTSFNSFPTELKELGIEEVLFLQQSAEEKLLSLKLKTELKTADKIASEKDLVDAQKSQVQTETVLRAQQALTELENTAKVAAETSLLGEQEDLVEAQALDVAADTTLKGKQGSLVDAQATDVAADTTLKGKQGSLVDAQATDVAADTTLKGKQGSLVDAQATDVAADTTLKGKQGSLVDAQATDVAADTTLKGKQGSLVDAQATDVAADTTLKGKQGSLVDAQATDVAADTTLKGKQGSLVDAQATDVVADTTLKGKQGSLIDNQAATELKKALDVAKDTEVKGVQKSLIGNQATKTTKEANLLEAQKTQLLAQTAIEATAEKAFYDGVVAGTQDTYRDYAAEMRIMGVQEVIFQQTPAYKKIELIKDAAKLRTATATDTGTDATEIAEVNKVMRFIGEPPISALNSNSLASECVRLLRDTDKELQGRGWWFNTETDVELELNGSAPHLVNVISLASNILSVEANEYRTRIALVSGARRLYDLKEKSTTSWTSAIKAKVIYQRDLADTPIKYREYLSVRVAILLTELYPQSGVDIQRLPKMEAELRAYFKDRDFDQANYTMFDNYDTASILGVNRPITLI